MLLLSDDAKIYKEIISPADVEALISDMKRIEEWSNKWLLISMKTNVQHMNIGSSNLKLDYRLNEKILKKNG